MVAVPFFFEVMDNSFEKETHNCLSSLIFTAVSEYSLGILTILSGVIIKIRHSIILESRLQYEDIHRRRSDEK